MTLPLVSVITSTWRRHDLLLNRCVPSVDLQTYGNVEHIIISDGPDPELAEKLFPPKVTSSLKRWFGSLPEHDVSPHWGHLARLRGLELATGELIAYCDDDDALRPNHCAVMAAALKENPEAGWASSRMLSHRPDGEMEIGVGPPSCGNLGTPMIFHRRSVLEHGTWGPQSDFEDWDLVNRWIHAEIGYVQVDKVTIDVWPSLFYRDG
jgi:glycosyltransferase involved in cell wall biosynthesis